MEHKLKKNDIDALEQTKFEKMTCFQIILLNNFSHIEPNNPNLYLANVPIIVHFSTL